jgi:hypothetical protein
VVQGLLLIAHATAARNEYRARLGSNCKQLLCCRRHPFGFAVHRREDSEHLPTSIAITCWRALARSLQYVGHSFAVPTTVTTKEARPMKMLRGTLECFVYSSTTNRGSRSVTAAYRPYFSHT